MITDIYNDLEKKAGITNERIVTRKTVILKKDLDKFCPLTLSFQSQLFKSINEICCLLLPLHTLNLTLSNSFSYRNPFNYEIKDKDTNEKVFELAHFSTRLQHPMEWHLVQLVFRLSMDILLFRKKKNFHSHRDIYSINIILQCPLLLINSCFEEGCRIKYLR